MGITVLQVLMSHGALFGLNAGFFASLTAGIGNPTRHRSMAT